MTDAPLWFVRSGRESRYVGDFEEKGIVALGWSAIGGEIDGAAKDELARLIRAENPSESEGAAQNGASQLVRWRDDVAVGDAVATYDRDRRRYLLGTVTSGLRYDEETLPPLPRVRSADWTRHVPRDALSGPTRRPLNTMLTLSRTRPEVAAELWAKSVPLDRPLDDAAEAVATTATADPSPGEARPAPDGEPAEVLEDEAEFGALFAERADEAVEERILRLSPGDMEHFVAGLLRGMGYRTTVSPTGADRGVDVFASPDGLGLEEPRIFVEVKHRRNTAMGAPDLRRFMGGPGRAAGDRGIYVSTGGFTHEAKYEADRSTTPLRLLGLKDLRKLVVDLYPKLDEETRALIPLRRVYVPAD